VEEFLNLRFGRVSLARQVIHTAADGRKYRVLHGHQADGLAHFNRLLDRVGTRVYQWILDFNVYYNRVRRSLGFGYWSVAAYLKFKAKAAVKYVSDYEETIAQMARKLNVDGVICGHIHRAEIKTIGDVRYLNCGDWVESCTALVEDFDGNMQLLHLHENPILLSKRGMQSPNGSDGDEGDAGDDGASIGGRYGTTVTTADILRIGHADAFRRPADGGVCVEEG